MRSSGREPLAESIVEECLPTPKVALNPKESTI